MWAQETQIGADMFSDGDQTMIWATDLRTGEPLPGVEVEFVGSGKTVTTDAEGLVQTTTPSGSSESSPVVARHDGDSAIIESGWYQWSRSDRVPLVRLRRPPDVPPRRDGAHQGMGAAADRQRRRPTGRLASGAKISYQANDWYGNEIGTGTVDVNALGGFDFQFDIPAGANLGQAWINLSLSGAGVAGDYGHTIQIEEFRRPEFEVKARAESAGPYIVGDPATVAVEADYYSGGPLPDAEVEWTVTTRQATYAPPNWDDFTFGVWIPWWYNDYGPYGDVAYEGDGYYGEYWPGIDEGTVEEFSGRTDPLGLTTCRWTSTAMVRDCRRPCLPRRLCST